MKSLKSNHPTPYNFNMKELQLPIFETISVNDLWDNPFHKIFAFLAGKICISRSGRAIRIYIFWRSTFGLSSLPTHAKILLRNSNSNIISQNPLMSTKCFIHRHSGWGGTTPWKVKFIWVIGYSDFCASERFRIGHRGCPWNLMSAPENFFHKRKFDPLYRFE